MFCEYKDIFGKPGEGVHKYRIFGLAAVDLILTIFAAVFLAKQTGKNFFLIFGVLMFLSVIFHSLFCVDTALMKFVI